MLSGCQVTSDGGHMMCTCGSSIKVLEVKTLSVERSLEEVYVCVCKSEKADCCVESFSLFRKEML